VFDWPLLQQNAPLLLGALWVTLQVSIAALAIGFVIGVIVGALRLSPIPLLRRLGGAYIFVFRGIPLLVQLLFIYYFLPRIGLPNVSPTAAAVIGLSLAAGAYTGDPAGRVSGHPRRANGSGRIAGVERHPDARTHPRASGCAPDPAGAGQ